MATYDGKDAGEAVARGLTELGKSIEKAIINMSASMERAAQSFIAFAEEAREREDRKNESVAPDDVAPRS